MPELSSQYSSCGSCSCSSSDSGGSSSSIIVKEVVVLIVVVAGSRKPNNNSFTKSNLACYSLALETLQEKERQKEK